MNPWRLSTGVKTYKVALLGPSGVGKTMCAARLKKEPFSAEYKRTVACDMTVSSEASDSGVLELWDTAGDSDYHNILPMYISNCSGFVFVCDVSDADSLDALQWFVECAQKAVENERAADGRDDDYGGHTDIDDDRRALSDDYYPSSFGSGMPPMILLANKWDDDFFGDEDSRGNSSVISTPLLTEDGAVVTSGSRLTINTEVRIGQRELDAFCTKNAMDKCFRTSALTELNIQQAFDFLLQRMEAIETQREKEYYESQKPQKCCPYCVLL